MNGQAPPPPLVRARGAGGTAMVRIEDLHKSFGKLHVLKGINLEVDKGEVLCIVGPSGSGKSTLLRCINFLEIPDRGTHHALEAPAARDGGDDGIGSGE